jgi:hypothetical protein
MEGRAIRGVAACALCAFTFFVARAAIVQQTGQYALAEGKPQIASRLSLINGRNGLQTLVLSQYALHSTAPLTRYELTEDEPLHIAIVRDDFQSFGHVHPQMSGKGVFRVPYLLERGHRYYAYVASQPAGRPEQVFRFVLQSGAPHNLTATVKAPSVRARAGPYDVSLDQSRVPAMRSQSLTVDINRDPRTSGVAPYHVAWAHAFLVNTSSLTYSHIDGASDRSICCEYALRAPPLPKGLYKMWLQFNDGTSTYTAPFTFAAR